MEKIYQNDENNKKHSFLSQLFNDKISMVVTIAVAFIAIVGLVAFGINKISYAAGDVNSLPDSFTTQRIANPWSDGSNNLQITPTYGSAGGSLVPVYSTSYAGSLLNGQSYTSPEKITDNGLVYLLANLYPNKTFKKVDGTEYEIGFQYYISQAAVWTYLFETGDSNCSGFAAYANIIRNAKKVYTEGISYEETAPFFVSLGIDNLIEQAEIYKERALDPLTINKESGVISMTTDGVYYMTAKISVVGSTTQSLYSDFTSYKVDIPSNPSGIKLVDEEGREYASTDMMSPSSKFYVRVPIEVVTNENKQFDLNITANYKGSVGNIYTAAGSQPLAMVNTGTVVTISKPLSINLDYSPDVPGTGMNTAQTLIFVGIIILLSGIGIMYATKPKKD